MPKSNLENEIVIRSFLRWLEHARGRCAATLRNVRRSIEVYQTFSRYADFRTFSADKAIGFKQWLGDRRINEKPLSVATLRVQVHNVGMFFAWLAGQPKYRRLTKDSASYLRLTEKEERMARQVIPKNFPDLAYVRKLVASIDPKTEVDFRDRALISFSLLTGMSDRAIATLPLDCFDEKNLRVIQDPKRDVETKFSKLIVSKVFRFDKEMLGFFLQWVMHLKSKGFGARDPCLLYTSKSPRD